MTGLKQTALAALPLLLLLLLAPADGELLLAYSIQRHGARNVLPKSALLTESDAAGGPTLLPAGKQMCYDAGLAFSRRYISRPTCAATCLSTPSREQYGVVNTPGVGFHNYNSFANSSALDRAILSGNSFLAGVFASAVPKNGNADLQAAVPLYSSPDSEDWRIRGYSKCPTYQKRLSAWLKSDGFRQKEEETAALRAKVQAIAPQLNTSLAQWWDVYDAFNVWRTWGVGNPLPAIDNETFTQVTELAMWLETSKMEPGLTGSLLGGGLLGDVLHRMAAAEAAYQANSQALGLYYKLLTVSGHYNTQLGLLSALQSAVPAPQRTQHRWLSKIPSLAAVLVLELHASSSGQLVVRAVFQDGPKAAYTTLPLPCAEAGDAAEAAAGPGACTLEGFKRLAEPAALLSVGEWCEACGNSKVMACAVHNMERQLKEVGVDPQAAAADGTAARTSFKGRPVSPGMVAVWCVVSVAAAAVLAGAVSLVARRLRGRGRKHHGSSLSHSLGEATGVQSLHQAAPV